MEFRKQEIRLITLEILWDLCSRRSSRTETLKPKIRPVRPKIPDPCVYLYAFYMSK